MTAAEALQLGIVDQVTDHDTVGTAVKLALSVAGETQDKIVIKKEKQIAQVAHRYETLSLLIGVKKLSGRRRNICQSSYFGQVRHQGVSACRLSESEQAEKQDRQILHHRSYKCFMALSDVL